MTLSQQLSVKNQCEIYKECYSARLFILYINDKKYIFLNKYYEKLPVIHKVPYISSALYLPQPYCISDSLTYLV